MCPELLADWAIVAIVSTTPCDFLSGSNQVRAGRDLKMPSLSFKIHKVPTQMVWLKKFWLYDVKTICLLWKPQFHGSNFNFALFPSWQTAGWHSPLMLGSSSSQLATWSRGQMSRTLCKATWFGRQSILSAFFTSMIISTYDEFVRMLPHRNLRSNCAYLPDMHMELEFRGD